MRQSGSNRDMDIHQEYVWVDQVDVLGGRLECDATVQELERPGMELKNREFSRPILFLSKELRSII